MQETQVRFLGWEDPLEKEMGTHSSILTWRIPCTEEPGGPQSIGLQESDMTEQLNHHDHVDTGDTYICVYVIYVYIHTHAHLCICFNLGFITE